MALARKVLKVLQVLQVVRAAQVRQEQPVPLVQLDQKERKVIPAQARLAQLVSPGTRDLVVVLVLKV